LKKNSGQINLHPAGRFSTLQFKEQLFFRVFSDAELILSEVKHISGLFSTSKRYENYTELSIQLTLINHFSSSIKQKKSERIVFFDINI